MYFEEFEVGMVIDHAVRRTITETDNILFTTLMMKTAPLHLDVEFSKNSFHGDWLVSSLFTHGLVCGISMQEMTQGTTLGNLGFTETKFPKPVFHGDTLRVQTEILDTRESKSRGDCGIVTFRHIALNQHDEVVCDTTRADLMIKKHGSIVRR